MSRYDATQTNESKRRSRIYKDLNLGFQKNTATKDIQKLTDVEGMQITKPALRQKPIVEEEPVVEEVSKPVKKKKKTTKKK